MYFKLFILNIVEGKTFVFFINNFNTAGVNYENFDGPLSL